MHKASTPEKTPSSFKLLISGYRDYVGAVKNLILAECRLFATSVAQLLCLAVLAAMVAASLWMVVCAIIYLTLLNAGASIIEALAALLILHIALLVAIGWAIHHSIAGLELQHLRQQLTADKSR